MTAATNEELSFDERADRYVEMTNLLPQTYKGDVQTAYCTACGEQQDVDKAAYTPYINYLQQALTICIRLVRENCKNSSTLIAVDGWEKGIEEQKGKVPYDLLRLPNGITI